MRSSMNLICSCFKIFLIMTAIFNDSKFVCNVLNAKSIWLIVMKKHYTFYFRFLTSINKQKEIASIIAIFVESFEFNFENETNSDCCCFFIFYFLLRWSFNVRLIQNNVFVCESLFATSMISTSNLFCSKINNSLQQLIFEFDVIDSSSTIKVENSILKRNKIVYRDSAVAICFALFSFDNTTLRRQLNTFHRRFDSKISKRLILTTWLNMLSWWLHLKNLKINLSYVIFNMTSCLFIHDFSKIIEWLFKSMINKKTVNSKCNSIVNLKYMTWIIDKTWRLSNSIKSFNFNKNTDFMCNMSHTNCAICLSMKAYFVTSMSIRISNLCWLLSKNKIQLMISDFLTKKSNMLSSRIEKILIESKSSNSMFKFIWIICKLCHWRFLYFCALKQNFHVCFNSSQMKHLLVKINVSIIKSRLLNSINEWT